MANAVRVRVELGRKFGDPKANLKQMIIDFRRAVNDAGIPKEIKERQSYESKSQKKRRKRRESLNKRRMEELEQKVLAGERVKAPSGLVKKILEKNKKRDRRKGDEGGTWQKTK